MRNAHRVRIDFLKEVDMPRREKDRVLARRRKRKEERRKLRAKGLLAGATPAEGLKGIEKKKSKKAAPREAAHPEAPRKEEVQKEAAAKTEPGK